MTAILAWIVRNPMLAIAGGIVIALSLALGVTTWRMNSYRTAWDDARAATAICQSANASNADTITQLRAAVDRAITEARATAERADAALAARDAATAARNRDAAKRKSEMDRLYATPDCAAMARMPVCDAVADRLWPRETTGAD